MNFKNKIKQFIWEIVYWLNFIIKINLKTKQPSYVPTYLLPFRFPIKYFSIFTGSIKILNMILLWMCLKYQSPKHFLPFFLYYYWFGIKYILYIFVEIYVGVYSYALNKNIIFTIIIYWYDDMYAIASIHLFFCTTWKKYHIYLHFFFGETNENKSKKKKQNHPKIYIFFLRLSFHV